MFDSHYEVVLADSPAARTIHHKIRYHVYCVERGFENPARFPTGEERDPWDDDSVHFVVRERGSGRCVAAMRLILPRAVDFPVEALGCLEPSRTEGLRRRQLAEISRICVVRTPATWMYRGASLSGLGQVPKSRELDVLLGMLRTINVYGTERGIEHCYLLVTEAFVRVLRRMGVVLRQAGSAVDYRGSRTPYLVSLRESAASMRAKAAAIERLFSRERLAYRRSSEIDEDTVDPDSLLIQPAVALA